MDAVAALPRIRAVQSAFEVIAALTLTAYLFPKQSIVTDQELFDFIVVGAGSAGAVVAARLAENHYSVLLVDAGGDPPQESLTPGLLAFLPQTRYDWNYTAENNNYTFQCHRTKTANLTSGRMLGGSSSINYMLYVRGCPGDFDSWAAAARDSTWNWGGVLPYFIKSEKLRDQEIINSPLSIYHGTQGFLGVSRQRNTLGHKYLESFREVGNDIILDINSNKHVGYNYPMFTISDGVRQSTAYSVLAAFKNQHNLQVLKETFVNRIILDGNNNAVAIQATSSENKEITLRATKEIIISAGALNTPRILMSSGIGPKDHLRMLNIPLKSDLPVGENLQDHPAILIPLKLEKHNDPPPVPDPRLFPFDTITGYVALNKSNSCPDYQTISLIIHNNSESILNLCVFNLGFNFEICQKIYDVGRDSRMLFTALILLHPKSRGRVLLRSTNPREPPVIHGGYISDDRDLETIVDSVIDYVKVLKAPYMKGINASLVDLKLNGCAAFKYGTREWWKCYVKCLMTSIFHYTSTCSLGSVVDSRLRVFGVNRLRVADASIMPQLVSGNTNAATIMIGEKAADFIMQDYLCYLNLYSTNYCASILNSFVSREL